MHSHKARMVINVLGSSLILFLVGFHSYWGNMATYVLSYLHHNDPSVKGNESSWVISIHLFTRNLLLIGSGYMIRRLGKRLTSVIGIFLYTLGLAATYFALERSMAVITVTIGVISGCGSGILYGASLEYSLQWTDGNKGLILSIVQSSFNMGAILANHLLTVYINPNNKVPDLKTSDYVFFDQSDILSRVPVSFLILAACPLGIYLIGFFMVRERSDKFQKGEEIILNDDTSTGEVENAEYNMSVPSSRTSQRESLLPDLPPSQVIRTSSFYVLWMSFFFGEFEYLLIANYYKIFGQLWIKDDIYLSVLGSVLVCVSVAAKIVFGQACDKMSLKYVLMGNSSLMAVFSSWLYFSPRVSRWLYFANTVAAIGPSCVISLATTVSVDRLYGEKHMVVNSGLVNTSLAAMQLVAPPILELVLSVGGWSWLFFLGAALSAVSFFIMTIFLPRI